MKIISGYPGKLNVHYVAPPYHSLPSEILGFLRWFNHDSTSLDGLLRAAIAHLWFELLHPFDDGNGRLGRAIIDMALSQDEKAAKRYYSLSKQIFKDRKGYYAILNQTSIGKLDITPWLRWFLNRFITAIEDSLNSIEKTVQKAKFWQRHQLTELNKRQIKALKRLLDAGCDQFVV